MAAPRAMKFCVKMPISRVIYSTNCRKLSTLSCAQVYCPGPIADRTPLGRNRRHFVTSVPKFDSFNIQDTADFQTRVLESDKPVVVDFHASWCGPCKMLGPRLETVMLEYKDKMHFAKVDIDENTDLALEYGVEAVPAVLGFKKGQIVARFVGLQDEDKIKSFAEKTMSS